jgi:hypothetical protein
VNRELCKAGISERVDHRSHRRREAAGDAPRQLALFHRGKALNALWQRHTAHCALAARSGVPLPPTPTFIRDFKRRKRLNRHARQAWLDIRAEVDDWLDQPSSFDEDGTELLTELATSARLLNKAVSGGLPLRLKPPRKPSNPSDAILAVHLHRSLQSGKKPRTR